MITRHADNADVGHWREVLVGRFDSRDGDCDEEVSVLGYDRRIVGERRAPVSVQMFPATVEPSP